MTSLQRTCSTTFVQHDAKIRGRRRQSGKSVCPLALFFAAFVLLSSVQWAHCATLFFGATSNANPEEIGVKRSLASAATSADDDEEEGSSNNISLISLFPLSISSMSSIAKLSTRELLGVYKFCAVLPLLEREGRVDEDDQSREICERIVALVQPHLAQNSQHSQEIEFS